MLLNPFGQAAVLWALGAAAIVASPRASALTALVVVSIFTLGSPLVNALRRRWWLNTLLTILAWILLLGALSATGDAVPNGRIGEGGMVLMLPMMAFPVALLLSGVFRWWRGATIA